MEKEINLKQARHNLVAKRNDMIQNSRFALDIIANKAVLYLLSKVQPDDEPGKHYMFNCSEFQSLIRWNNKQSYTEVKALLTKISTMAWWVDISEEEEALVKWFDIVHMNKGSGNIEISFHQDMFPFILELNRQRAAEGKYFTTYQYQYISLMKHQYSPRIYEILKSYHYNNQKWIFENGTGSKHDLQRLIANVDPATQKSLIPESWKNWAIFKRDVLNKAIEEINKYTDLMVGFEGRKVDLSGESHRSITTIEFFMVRKTDTQQEETDKLLDKEYERKEDERNFHQLTLEETFFKEHGKRIQEDLENKKEKKVEVIEKEQIQRDRDSKYPLLADIMPEFTERQLHSLFSEASKHKQPGIVPFSQWELWAVDYITHYYDLIQATPEDTKTTTYKRLLDMVRKDYEKIAATITESYRRA